MSESELYGKLLGIEKKYGLHENVERRRVSHRDPRLRQELSRGGMRGGDRMGPPHHYGQHYARELMRFVGQAPKIIEVGVLKGTGLALWSEVFPRAELIGLDIDLSHYLENVDNLRRRGAFRGGDPKTFIFDQFEVDLSRLENDIFGANIVIDDGVHIEEAALHTFGSLRPTLAKDWVYFIEDMPGIGRVLRKKYGKEYHIHTLDALTIIRPRD